MQTNWFRCLSENKCVLLTTPHLNLKKTYENIRNIVNGLKKYDIHKSKLWFTHSKSIFKIEKHFLSQSCLKKLM